MQLEYLAIEIAELAAIEIAELETIELELEAIELVLEPVLELIIKQKKNILNEKLLKKCLK